MDLRLSTSRSLLVLLLGLSACGGDAESASEGGASADSSAAAAPAEPREAVGPATTLPPNELGEIMVLEYHRLGSPEGEFVRTAAHFQADLELLYQNGYRPITVRQFLDGDFVVPRGTTPVIFTIDDSSRGQFAYLPDGSIDPGSMVGMWDAFKKGNPGWEGGATWCVLPAADHPSNFFGEKPSREVPREEREAAIKRKVDHLLAGGHEICNHTLYHARLDRAESDAQVQEWIGRGEDSIHVYLPPDYDIVTFALPLGMWPDNRALASKGTYKTRNYEYRGVLEVSGGPNVSPFDREYDPMSIDRFIVAPNALERQIAAYEADPSRRFISDGIPKVITVLPADSSRVNTSRWPNHQVKVGTTAPS